MTLSAKTPVAQTLTAQKYFAGPAYISADPSGGTFYPQGENGMQDIAGGYLHDRGIVLSSWSDDSGGDFKADNGGNWIILPWSRVQAFRLLRGGMVVWEAIGDGYQTGGAGPTYQTYRWELMVNGTATGVQLDFPLTAHTGYPTVYQFTGELRVVFEPSGPSYTLLTAKLNIIDPPSTVAASATKHYVMDYTKFNPTIDQDITWRTEMVTANGAGNDIYQFKSGGSWIPFATSGG